MSDPREGETVLYFGSGKPDKSGILHFGRANPYKGKEDDFQETAALFFAYKPDLNFFHVANERKTTIQSGAKLKRKGVKPGVSDCIINTPTRTGFHGVDIELKVEGGRLSKEQLEFLLKSKNDGRFACVCWNLEAIQEVISRHYQK